MVCWLGLSWLCPELVGPELNRLSWLGLSWMLVVESRLVGPKLAGPELDLWA